MQQPDEQVLKALIYTLDYDRNVNVRIAAADAIGRFGNNANVRDALVKSLLKQQEPTLQISIIDILTKFNERRALPALRLLSRRWWNIRFCSSESRRKYESVEFVNC